MISLFFSAFGVAVTKYADLGVKLVGELVYYMLGWSGYGSRELYEILRVAADRKMTLNIHPSRHDTEGMERLAASLPDMNIVIAHLDGYGLYEWSVEMMKKHKIYLKSSTNFQQLQALKS